MSEQPEAAPLVASEEELDAFMDGTEESAPQEEANEELEEGQQAEELEAEQGETPETDDDQPPPVKHKGGVEKKIGKLTKRVYERDTVIKNQAAEIERLRSQPAQVVGEPNEDDFDTDEEYHTALRKYDRDLIKKEIKQESVVDNAQTESSRIISEYEQRVVEANIEGYQEAENALAASFAENDPGLGNLFNTLLVDKETGPQLTVYLGRNTEKAHEIARMTQEERSFALGKISARLSAPITKKTTKAPNPIKPLGSGGRLPKKATDMSMDEIMSDDNI